MEIIFNCYLEEIEFDSKEELEDFVKDLFSLSDDHPSNEKTKYNFYVRKDFDGNKTGTIFNNQEKYEKFIDIIDLDEYEDFSNDTFNMFFIIEFNNQIITNMFDIDDENNSIEFNIDNESFEYITERYFNDEEDELYALENKIYEISENNNMKIISYNDFLSENDKETQRELELIIHKNLIKKAKDQDVIFQISHIDQEDKPYHIHRLKNNS